MKRKLYVSSINYIRYLSVIMLVCLLGILVTGCSTESKNYTQKEVTSYLNEVYGKDAYIINNKTSEDDQTDIYEIAYDNVIFTVKSYVSNGEKSIEDTYCKAKSQQFFSMHGYNGIVEKYLKQNIHILFYSPDCPTAHCGRREQHFSVGAFASPTVRFGRQLQTLNGVTAHCRSLI